MEKIKPDLVDLMNRVSQAEVDRLVDTYVRRWIEEATFEITRINNKLDVVISQLTGGE